MRGKTSLPSHSTGGTPCKEGRVPTPVLRANPDEHRHHLDRTTPSVGSMLTSPPLPVFLKPSKTKTSRSAGGPRGERASVKSERQSGLKATSASSSRTTGTTQRREKQVTAEPTKAGLRLSQRSPKLKRDPSLVSSVSGGPHSSSHYHSLPKSTKSHPPPSLQRASRLSTQTPQYPLTKPNPPSLPSSSISSLLSLNPSSTSPARKSNYNNVSSHSKSTQQILQQSSKLGQSHTHSGCTSTQCDVCGAWLRKMHTGAQVSSLSQVPCPASRTLRYKGPVTQLSQTNPCSSSQTCKRSSTRDNTLSFPHMLPQTKETAFSVPPHTPSSPLQEVDNLSISTLSLSSCSVASDLLKRAQERRERFWTQPLSHTSS